MALLNKLIDKHEEMKNTTETTAEVKAEEKTEELPPGKQNFDNEEDLNPTELSVFWYFYRFYSLAYSES